ncbi:MAG: PBS lyase [Deltaproteobacteria bacterium]|nr:PBS lyase [Deltaproteobacteria bacterium]MBW2047013.1 PBS lyase [Deltaproteobacteria bacterium]MBW2111102.1 PBS lyase [Deltaproteobacteria bacterium]HDZ91887.1 PBS lyase [Deltaproteobacteria bacterium]
MFESRFIGKEPVKRPQCPFCGQLVEAPKELSTRKPGEMPMGSCSCGAVYACDETGHNLGSAMIEALVFGCDMDWDLAWGLEPEEDYLQEIVENYDLISHLIIPSGSYEGRRIGGALYFIRLHRDIQEVASEGVRQRLAGAVPVSSDSSTRHGRKKTLSKREVETLVRDYEIRPIEDAAGKDKKMIRYLQRILYSGDPQLRQRAAESLGRVCAVIGQRDPGIISKLLQGLFYSIVDTAAFSPGAFEAIGEIIAHRPDLFGGYAPQLYQFLADPTRKASAIQALGRIALSSPKILRKHTLHFFAFLDDPDPEVRGYTAWLMGNLGAHEARKDVEALMGESHEIEMYWDGFIEKKSVGLVASEAAAKL